MLVANAHALSRRQGHGGHGDEQQPIFDSEPGTAQSSHQTSLTTSDATSDQTTRRSSDHISTERDIQLSRGCNTLPERNSSLRAHQESRLARTVFRPIIRDLALQRTSRQNGEYII